jgi:toxin ParE1/3/4
LKYKVVLLEEAEEDLFEIHQWVSRSDSPAKGESLLARLEEACSSLSRFRERGRVPPDLRRLGVTLYRETLVRPFRIVYRVEGSMVLVYACLDGRRDLTDLLEERLLR